MDRDTQLAALVSKCPVTGQRHTLVTGLSSGSGGATACSRGAPRQLRRRRRRGLAARAAGVQQSQAAADGG
jgi:hypothetical protein